MTFTIGRLLIKLGDDMHCTGRGSELYVTKGFARKIVSVSPSPIRSRAVTYGDVIERRTRRCAW